MRKSSVCPSKYVGDLRVGRGDVGPEAIGREADQRELHLVVAAAVLLLELLVGNREPFGERRPQLFDDQRAPDRFLEVGRRHRRTLHRQQLPITVFADERAVFLERGNREDALPHFVVADRDVEAFRFGERRPLVDHLLQDLLLDAELPQQLVAHVGAVCRTVGLDLRLIGPLELVRANLAAFDHGHRAGRSHVAGRVGQKVRDEKDDHRHAHDEQAPLEPIPVLAHPIEHRHFWILGKP